VTTGPRERKEAATRLVLHEAALAVAAGTGIELLQWALPLRRVVSPVDAALNAAGAVVAGLLVALSGGRSVGAVPRRLG
jgi:hypothetical protein